MTRRGHSWRTLALSSALLLSAPSCILFAPDTHGDMRVRLDAVPVSPHFIFLFETGGGLRSGFAAAPKPHVERGYAAPWKDRALCDELAAIVASMGDLVPRPASDQSDVHCTYVARTPSGWRGRIVGVNDYRLWVSAWRRDQARRFISDAECRDQLRRLGARLDRDLDPRCRLPSGHAMVTISLTGDQI